MLWQAISNIQEVFFPAMCPSLSLKKDFTFGVLNFSYSWALFPDTSWKFVLLKLRKKKKKKHCHFYARCVPFWRFRCLLPSWTSKTTQIKISVLIIHIFKGAALKGNHLWFCIHLIFKCKNCHQSGFVAAKSFTEKLWLRTTENYCFSSPFGLT